MSTTIARHAIYEHIETLHYKHSCRKCGDLTCGLLRMCGSSWCIGTVLPKRSIESCICLAAYNCNLEKALQILTESIPSDLFPQLAGILATIIYIHTYGVGFNQNLVSEIARLAKSYPTTPPIGYPDILSQIIGVTTYDNIVRFMEEILQLREAVADMWYEADAEKPSMLAWLPREMVDDLFAIVNSS